MVERSRKMGSSEIAADYSGVGNPQAANPGIEYTG